MCSDRRERVYGFRIFVYYTLKQKHPVLYHQETTMRTVLHIFQHSLCASLIACVPSFSLWGMTYYIAHIVLVVASYRHNHDHKASYIILRYII